MKLISREDLRVYLEQVPDDHPDLIRWDIARQIEAALHPDGEPSRAELLDASQKAVDTMRLLSPWIALLTAKLDSEKEYQKIDLEIFKPSIKELNEPDYLGYQGTNEYMAGLREIISEEFTVEGTAPHVLGLPFKGASIFAVNNMSHEDIRNRVTKIKRRATDLLIKKTIEVARVNPKYAGKNDDEIKASFGFDQIFYVDIEYGIKPWGKIDQDTLIASEEDAKKFAIEMEDSIRALYDAIRRTTLPERRAVNREEGLGDRRHSGRNIGDMHEERMADRTYIYKTLQSGYKEFFKTVTQADQESGEITIKPDWADFVRIEKGNLILNTFYIHAFRKGTLQKDLEKKGAGNKYPVIENYMRTLKILDTLHAYTIDGNFEVFLKKVRRIVALIKSAEDLTKLDDTALKEFLQKVSEELKISLKDEGDGTFATEHAMITYLMNNKGNVRLDIGDIQGFGDSSLALLSTQVAAISNAYDINKAESLKTCEEIILRSNDLGTMLLNKIKQKAQAQLPKGYNLSIYENGDEFTQLTTNVENLALNITEIAGGCAMRIFSVLLDGFQIKTKEDVRTLIAFFKFADTQTAKLKEAEVAYQGPPENRPLSIVQARYQEAA